MLYFVPSRVGSYFFTAKFYFAITQPPSNLITMKWQIKVHPSALSKSLGENRKRANWTVAIIAVP
jgi:hypothetical protein